MRVIQVNIYLLPELNVLIALECSLDRLAVVSRRAFRALRRVISLRPRQPSRNAMNSQNEPLAIGRWYLHKRVSDKSFESQLSSPRLRILYELQLYCWEVKMRIRICLLYTSPSPRDRTRSRMPSSA